MKRRHNPAERPAEHKGMGFEAAVESASGARNPRAAIASAAQHASAEAKRKNPNLSKVAGVGRKGHRGAGQKG